MTCTHPLFTNIHVPVARLGTLEVSCELFKVRMNEHMGQSNVISRLSHIPPHSAVREHIEVCNISGRTEKFEIIDGCKNSDLHMNLYKKSLSPQLKNSMPVVSHNVAQILSPH